MSEARAALSVPFIDLEHVQRWSLLYFLLFRLVSLRLASPSLALVPLSSSKIVIILFLSSQTAGLLPGIVNGTRAAVGTTISVDGVCLISCSKHAYRTVHGTGRGRTHQEGQSRNLLSQTRFIRFLGYLRDENIWRWLRTGTTTLIILLRQSRYEAGLCTADGKYKLACGSLAFAVARLETPLTAFLESFNSAQNPR